MNNFLFRNNFLVSAVDWDNVCNNSGKFFLRPGEGSLGLGYIRVDFEVIEHVMTSPSMLLDRDAFAQHLDRLEAGMILPVRDREINIPLGFNPEFDLDGEPTQAIHRVRRRLAMRTRLEEMHNGTPAGRNDPLYLCMLKQKEAILEFVNIINDFGDTFLPEEEEEEAVVDYSDLHLTVGSRRAIQSITWGPISYLGNKCGFTFTFYPFCSVLKRFRSVA